MSTSVDAVTGLLDVNALFALAWPNHQHHGAIREWISRHQRDGWATTPVTQSGLVRLSSNHAATATPATPGDALQILAELTAQPGHEFWPDDLDGVIGEPVERQALVGHRQVTDAHLLSLAHRHGGRLVTLDAKIVAMVKPDFQHVVEVLT